MENLPPAGSEDGSPLPALWAPAASPTTPRQLPCFGQLVFASSCGRHSGKNLVGTEAPRRAPHNETLPEPFCPAEQRTPELPEQEQELQPNPQLKPTNLRLFSFLKRTETAQKNPKAGRNGLASLTREPCPAPFGKRVQQLAPPESSHLHCRCACRMGSKVCGSEKPGLRLKA